MQTPPEQIWAAVQQLLQPQSRVPAPQSATQVPKLQTWPHMQPIGHDAGAQTYRVMSRGSREQVRPTGQVPGHWPPHPSPWPHIAPDGHVGMHTHRPAAASHVEPEGQYDPAQIPPQVSDAEVPQGWVGEQVCEQHAPPMQRRPDGHAVPVPGHENPGHALGIAVPHGAVEAAGQDVAHSHAPAALHRCPAGHRVPVPHAGPPGHTFGMAVPHATVAGLVAQRGMHWHAPPMHA